MFNKKLEEYYWKLEARVSALEKNPNDERMEIEKLKTQLISLRGLVNRRIGGESSTQKESGQEGFNNPVILPS